MDDARDRRTPRTPPKGVRAQTAKPVSESWDEDRTPIESSALDQISHRTKRTATAAAATLSSVTEVRRELRADIEQLDGKVAELAEHVGDLRQATGEIRGKLDVLVDVFQQDRAERKQSGMMRLSAFTAEIEVEKTAKLAEIEDHSKERDLQRDLKRQLITKLVAWIGTPLALLAGYLTSHC